MEITKERIFVRTAQCDISGNLGLGELFLMAQEIAGVGSASLGFGRDFTERENIFWVLSRVRAEMLRPVPRETYAILKTWHGDPIRYIFPRYFSLEDDNGGVYARVSSLWMLIDGNERSIIMPSLRGYQMPPARKDLPAYPHPGKLLFDFPLTHSAKRAPLYSDFDLNGHMNNSRYPVWVCDLFEPETFRERFIGEMHINYLHEILPREEVSLSYGEKDGMFAVRGSYGEEAKFEAAGKFLPLK